MRTFSVSKDSDLFLGGGLAGHTFIRTAAQTATILAALFSNNAAKAQIPGIGLIDPPAKNTTTFEQKDVIAVVEDLYWSAQSGQTLAFKIPYDGQFRDAVTCEVLERIGAIDPTDHVSHVAWQTNLCVLRSLDFELAEKYREKSLEHLNNYVELTRDWEKANRPIDFADRHIRALHILATVGPWQLREKCMDRIQNIESKILSDFSVELRDEMRRNAANAVSYAASITRNWQNHATGFIWNDASWKFIKDKIALRSGVTYFHPNGHKDKEEWEFLAPDPEIPDGLVMRRVDKRGPILTMDTVPCQESIRDGSIRKILDASIAEFDRYAQAGALDTLLKYDLPTDRRFAHLRVFPKDADIVIDACIMSSLGLADSLKVRYGENAILIPTMYSYDAIRDMEHELDRLYNSGIRDFSIDINNHGSKSAIHFGFSVSTYEIENLIRRYPGARFFFVTVACYGGGLADPLCQMPQDVSERCVFAFQTKPFVVNEITCIGNSNDVEVSGRATHRGSLYIFELIEGVHDKNLATIGQAMINADNTCRRLSPFDPEVVYQGHLFSNHQVENRMSRLLAAR